MTTPNTPPNTTAVAAAPSQRNGLGLAALIVGIVAVIFALIPFLSYIAWLVGIVAIVLGIIAIARAGARKKTSGIVGLILGVLAIVLSIVMSIVYTAVFVVAAAGSATSLSTADVPSPAQSAAASAPASSAAAAGSRTVTYTVTGSGKANTISYFTVNGGQSGSEQANGEKLPWKKVVKIKDDGLFESSVFSLTAQNGGTGKITCKIEADGKVISKHTSSGQYAVVSCSGSAGQ